VDVAAGRVGRLERRQRSAGRSRRGRGVRGRRPPGRGPVGEAGPVVSGLVGCDSGALFIGPGEDITGGGLEPNGFRLPCPVGSYRVWVAAPADGELSVWLEPVAGPPVNHLADYPRL
jgi:hypothetical protein